MADTVADNALSSIWGSKRALLTVALLIAVSVLAALRVLTADQWIGYTKWIFTVWVGGESLTASAQHFANAKKDNCAPAPTDTTPGAPA